MKSLKLLSAILLGFMISSCTKNEACIDGPSDIKIKDQVTFTFCGTYKELRWEVYDGIETTEYTTESITHTFNHLTDEAYVIAYAEGKKDEKNDSEKLDITVTGSVVFQVKNGSTNVSAATVNVYKDEACWEDPSGSGCLITSGETDSDGKVEFSELEVDGDYFVEVTTDDFMSNWGSSNNFTSMTFSSGLDEFTGSIEIVNSLSVDRDIRYLLCSADKWKLVKVRNSGGSDIWSAMPTCRKDDYLEFDKTYNWSLSEADDECNPPFVGTGKYTNTTYTAYPPAFDITTSNSTGTLSIQGDKITVVDENNIKFVEAATGQTYELQRQ